ncbi:MAG TPA: hypothetical protein VHR66_06085 [Gemmataceae bacterium]|jgi:hypothetical protein|nr:hypothetical protein [Gemmataceae bacterium]
MKMKLRSALAAVLFVAAALTAYPSLAEDTGVDFWNYPDLQFGLSRREAESRELDRESEITAHRTLVRIEIANDVAENRITFEEGVARFADINRSNAKAMNFTRKAYDGKSDEERAGWQLVSHLRVHRHPDAGVAAERGSRWLREHNDK